MNEPTGSISGVNFLTSCKPVSFSRRTLLYGVSKEVKLSQNVSNWLPTYAAYHPTRTEIASRYQLDGRPDRTQLLSDLC